MDRHDALHTLGLSDDATPEDVKTAYRECVQILHPDRFAGNKKLQERATEQFKHLQEAYDLLTSDNKSTFWGFKQRSGVSKRNQGRASDPSSSRSSGVRTPDEVEYDNLQARKSAIGSARIQLTAQMDHALDERRTGIIMIVIGALVAAITFRRAFGILGVLCVAGLSILGWGISRVVTSHQTLSLLQEHLQSLAAQIKEIDEELSSFEVIYE